MNTFTVSIPGFTIAGKAYGDPNLPPMLALHGWLDNANSFDLLAPYLEKHFYLLAVDLPGHGHSSHLPEGCYYHFSDGIFTTLAIIKALQFRQVHLLGHSMGACLASLIAGVAPEAILSLILIEGLGPYSKPEEACREQLAQYLHHTSQKEKEPRPYYSLMLAAQARSKRGYLSLEHAHILCERGTRKENNAIYWRHDRRLLTPTPLRMTEKQILSCLSNITAKSCLIWGKESSVFDDYDMETRIKSVAHLNVYYLQGGHHVHMEHPEALAKCLTQFYELT
ncbi:alpha/beta fold hydrolase [Legionella hackeliae]|uniref:Tropinesterase n=1 Tax=Legionella hackeliae TaxID=449 RepID=A0A0A8ULS6_LEGHA|nr:alpha/beta hydrolase [Legionella hackeliae]KTD10174.1 lipase A [Legionella hackeliae]CEK09668.1 Tropinesterase [Legionella hackeliae]STX49580.1 lipase A [Legionella hackeliae]